MADKEENVVFCDYVIPKVTEIASFIVTED